MQKDALQNVQNQITVLLADDHPTTRTGIRTILQETRDIRVVGEAENGFQVQEMVAELRPNILLLDLVMPGPTPAELEKWVRTNSPETVTRRDWPARCIPQPAPRPPAPSRRPAPTPGRASSHVTYRPPLVSCLSPSVK